MQAAERDCMEEKALSGTTPCGVFSKQTARLGAELIDPGLGDGQVEEGFIAVRSRRNGQG